MRQATQYGRFLDGQWHDLTPGVDVTAKTLNGVASSFKSAAYYRGLVPHLKWNSAEGTISVRAAATGIRPSAADVSRKPAPTMGDYLAKYPYLNSSERAEMTGRILAAHRGL